MKCWIWFATSLLAMGALDLAHARSDDMDIQRLNGRLEQLASDPLLGSYAQASQLLAHKAIAALTAASRDERAHALYMAERQVSQAKAQAQLQYARSRLAKLNREYDQLLLQRSHIDMARAQKELEFQRVRNQIAKEEELRLQQQAADLKRQGLEAASQASQARAEAERARKLAAAQSRVARAAKREAKLAAAAARVLRSQMLRNRRVQASAAHARHHHPNRKTPSRHAHHHKTQHESHQKGGHQKSQ